MRVSRFVSIVAVPLTVACGGSTSSTTTPTTATVAFHGEVSDPSGDAASDPNVSPSPDLVRAAADVSAATMTVTVQFAAGTFDRASTRVALDIDTDQVQTTGVTAAGLGIDYTVDLRAPANLATISRAVGNGPCAAGPNNPCYTQTATAALTLLADGMTVTLPLAALGNDDGRVNFRMFSYAMRLGSAGGATPTFGSDVLPDITLAAGHIP